MQEVQEISLQELKKHPEIVLDALAQKHVSIVLRSEEDGNIRVFRNKYSPKAVEILKNAKHLVQHRNEAGFSKEDAQQEFSSLQKELADHLNSKP